MAHKACSKAQKVVRMILIPLNVLLTALKATDAGKTLLVGMKQVWIFLSSESNNLWYTECTEQVGWSGNSSGFTGQVPSTQLSWRNNSLDEGLSDNTI